MYRSAACGGRRSKHPLLGGVSALGGREELHKLNEFATFAKRRVNSGADRRNRCSAINELYSNINNLLHETLSTGLHIHYCYT